MKANYHTHTLRCKHAEGVDGEYIEAAISAGIKILGFSDHVPHPFKDDYVSPIRMEIKHLEDYFSSLSALKAEYKSEIEILIGFEAEYFPSLFGELIDILHNYNYDYLILGQHFIGEEPEGRHSGRKTDQDKYLINYVNQCIEAIETNCFTYIAHPDIIHYVGETATYLKHMKRLCQAAKQASMPLEFNLAGLQEGYHYPSEVFFKLAAEIGNEVILGNDAHCPEQLKNAELEEKGRAFAKKCGLKLIDSLLLNLK